MLYLAAALAAILFYPVYPVLFYFFKNTLEGEPAPEAGGGTRNIFDKIR